jgi:hypothetical protein
MKAKLKNSKDIREIERLFAELEALEWLQGQIAVFSHGDNNEAVLEYCYYSLCGKELKKKFDGISEYPLTCWRCI